MIPGPLPSKEADKLTLDMLESVAEQIGRESFHAVIVKAIQTCERRPTIAMLRNLAGLNSRLTLDAEAVAAAWSFIVGIVKRHIGRDGNGNAFLQPFISYRGTGGLCVQEDVPDTPIGIHEAVSAMGGWGALAESLPQWTTQKFNQFRDIYRPTTFEKNALLVAPPITALSKKAG